MTSTITLPFWLFIILLFSAILVFIRVVIFPLWASFWSARTRLVVEEVNPHLQLQLSTFTLTSRRVLADRLASDTGVESGIKEVAKVRSLSIEKVRREAWRMAWDIVPAFNPYFYFRIGYRVARRVLRSMYRLRIAFTNEQSMADVSDQTSVVFIINHRSNIDYMFACYLTAKHTMLSFGVGEWSRIWPIQPLMRMAGGYFVRRNSGDPLYRLMLKRYVQIATEARVPHAIFIEGQLSPDGSVGEPRLGLVSYLTEHYDPVTTPDLAFIPIGINYDHIVEDQNMMRFSSADFRAKGKKYVIFKGLQFSVKVIWELLSRRRTFGYACANFGEPISFSTWLANEGISWPELDRKERFSWINKLGDQLIDDIREIVPATPVSVLCRLWYEDPEKKISIQMMRISFLSLCSRLEKNGCHIVLVDNNVNLTLEHALKLSVRRGIIKCQGENYFIDPEQINLAKYYANSLSQFLTD